jgi:hypothetical protein
MDSYSTGCIVGLVLCACVDFALLYFACTSDDAEVAGVAEAVLWATEELRSFVSEQILARIADWQLVAIIWVEMAENCRGKGCKFVFILLACFLYTEIVPFFTKMHRVCCRKGYNKFLAEEVVEGEGVTLMMMMNQAHPLFTANAKCFAAGVYALIGFILVCLKSRTDDTIVAFVTQLYAIYSGKRDVFKLEFEQEQVRNKLAEGCDCYPERDCQHRPRCYPLIPAFDRKRQFLNTDLGARCRETSRQRVTPAAEPEATV